MPPGPADTALSAGSAQAPPMGPCYDTDRLIALGLDPRVRSGADQAVTAARAKGRLTLPSGWLRQLLRRLPTTQPRTVTVSPVASGPPSVTRA